MGCEVDVFVFVICVEMCCEFGVLCVEEFGLVYCVCLVFICLEVNVIKVCGLDGVMYGNEC